MSISDALNSSRMSLLTSGIQSSVVSRNIAGASQAGYSRKIAELATWPGTGVYVTGIQRAASAGLFNNTLIANSATAKQNALYDGLQKLAQTVDDPQLDMSPAAMLGKLRDALQQYATAPDNITLAQTAVQTAKDTATALNDATNTVQAAREQADADIASSVAKVNQLLSQFDTVNGAIVKGTITGADVTDYLDQRDSILTQLSQEMGITTAVRANGDMAVYTDSGAVLYDKVPRAVTFTQTISYNASTAGNSVYVDGIPVTGAGPSMMPIQSGKIAGLVQFRDKAAVTYQDQLDEVARGLIESFAEYDPAGVGPNKTGLFTIPPAPAGGVVLPLPSPPPFSMIVPGLAGKIMVDPSVDTTASPAGNPNLLRDGGIGDPTYVYNPLAPATTQYAGFSTRIQQLITNMDTVRNFDPTAQARTTGSLVDFAGSSASWIDGQLQSTDTQVTYQKTLLDRSTQALSNVNGVNMDDEMAFMLQIERTYSASAKLIATVDTMLQNLLAAATVTSSG